MSRLQVGGLALIVGYETNERNLYKTVKLEKYEGNIIFEDLTQWYDCWLVSGDDLLDGFFIKADKLYCRAKWLMPLGDKQTQDELMKELEIESC